MSVDQASSWDELSRDLGYPDLLPDELLFRWDDSGHAASKYLSALYSIARALGARRIVEVGFGRSSFVLARAAYESRGYFHTCDRTDYSKHFTKCEQRVARQFVGDSREFWGSLRHGIDLAFLDHFSDPAVDENFLKAEITMCFENLRRNGQLCIHNTNDSQFAMSDLLSNLAIELGAEHIVLPQNNGLSVLRRTTTSPYGTLYDSSWMKSEPRAIDSRPTIFIPSALETTLTGGPQSFMQNILEGLKEESYPVIRDDAEIEHAHAVFFPIKYDIKKLEEWKGLGKKIIQRLDGIYYPSQHGSEYKERNSDIEYIYKELVDVVVFQSGYSRDQCFEIMGEHGGSAECVIYNGAAIGSNPSDLLPKDRGKARKALMLGHIRHPLMIEPLVEICEKLDGTIELTIAGIIDENLKKFLSSKYVTALGQVKREEVQKLLQRSDFLLYSFLNPNCPNAVVEATANCLPVVSYNSGSMHELCLHNHELLAPVNDDVIQEEKDFEVEKLLSKVTNYLSNEEDFYSAAAGASSYFSLERMTSEYIEIFRNIEKI